MIKIYMIIMKFLSINVLFLINHNYIIAIHTICNILLGKQYYTFAYSDNIVLSLIILIHRINCLEFIINSCNIIKIISRCFKINLIYIK
jgi:hypothetical protein